MLLCTLKDNSGLTSGEIAEALGLTLSFSPTTELATAVSYDM